MSALIDLLISQIFIYVYTIILVVFCFIVEAIRSAERLLLDCYPSGTTASCLGELRGNMALRAFKESRVTFVAPTLPPTSNAFYHHCHRVAGQTFIWYQVYHSDIVIQSLVTYVGYETVFGETQLKWL